MPNVLQMPCIKKKGGKRPRMCNTLVCGGTSKTIMCFCKMPSRLMYPGHRAKNFVWRALAARASLDKHTQ